MRAVFRLVSLWFDNMSHAFVNAHLEASLASVPAHKFLPLFYQIVSRLSHAAERAPDGFQRLLRQTIERVAQRHPHHSLFQLFALKNGGKVRRVTFPIRTLTRVATVESGAASE